MIEIDNLSLNEWYTCLKPYQRAIIEQLVAKYGEERAAEELAWDVSVLLYHTLM